MSKLLCSRLEKVLPRVINQSHGAFVSGRELIFNVLMCQEVARGYNRKHVSLRCMTKIDLRKAYDSVYWEFVEELLASLKFLSMFIKLVKACIYTTTYTLHMNGNDYRYFVGGRGLRQGGPFSPLIFVLVMEYLSRLFKKASSEQGFKFHPHCKKTKLIHLLFADDLIMFSVVDPITVQLIIGKFSRSTGLEANKSKSQVVMGGAELKRCK